MHAAQLRFVVFAAVVATTVAVSSERARACSCGPITVENAMAQAAAIFEGRVLSVEPDPQSQGAQGVGPSTIHVRFLVVRTWKAANSQEVDAYTSSSSAACGYGFEVGKTYLVYANDTGRLGVSLCSRTALIEQAGEDLTALGAGSTPVDVPDEPAPAQGPESGNAGAPPGEVQTTSAGCASCTIAPRASIDRARRRGAGALALVATASLAVVRRRRRHARTRPVRGPRARFSS